MVEYFLAKEAVVGSNPITRSVRSSKSLQTKKLIVFFFVILNCFIVIIMNMNDYLKTLCNKKILQLLADKLITNSDIQRAFLKEESGDGVYDGKITEDNLKKRVFTRKMMNDFVDKIANWVKKVLDYEDKIKILTNKNNQLQIDLSNQINRYKKDVSTLANDIDKNKQNSAKQIEFHKKEIQKLKKENAELKTIISKEQQ